MTRPDHDPRRQAWSAYWSQGALHSCTGSFDARYSGAIGDFWDAFADALPAGARVLDLATGNGALPLRLWERDEGASGLRVDAVDLASVAPAWHDPATHAGIVFHQGVAMEALPFGDGTFDRVVSQFGLEYARRPEALGECVRVARPDGGLAFVMHHAGSVLVRVGRAELENHALLVAPGGLLDAAAGVMPWLAAARGGRAPGTEAIQAREAYNRAIAGIGEAIGRSDVPDALVEARDWVHRQVGGVTPPGLPASLEALAGYRAALEGAALRTREMISHALDDAAIAAMARDLAAARPDWQVRYEPLAQREGVLAWALRAS